MKFLSFISQKLNREVELFYFSLDFPLDILEFDVPFLVRASELTAGGGDIGAEA